MECKECYSTISRITPLLKPRDCLENHKQYICGRCGRCICIEKDKNRNLQRWNFPFKSLEIAKLYLRTADVTLKKSCGIYELVNEKARKSYKIFADISDLKNYLLKRKDVKCGTMLPVFQKEEYQEFSDTKIRMLTQSEVEIYLSEKTDKLKQR